MSGANQRTIAIMIPVVTTMSASTTPMIPSPSPITRAMRRTTVQAERANVSP